MLNDLAAALKRWKLACPPSADGLVFPKSDGTAMHRKVLQEQGLNPALARAELSHFGAHALRHFFARRTTARRLHDDGGCIAARTQLAGRHDAGLRALEPGDEERRRSRTGEAVKLHAEVAR
jgi:integrase